MAVKDGKASHDISTDFDDPFKSDGLPAGGDGQRELHMTSRGDGPGERANQSKTLEESTNVPLALLHLGEEQGGSFIVEDIKNGPSIRGGETGVAACHRGYRRRTRGGSSRSPHWRSNSMRRRIPMRGSSQETRSYGEAE